MLFDAGVDADCADGADDVDDAVDGLPVDGQRFVAVVSTEPLSSTVAGLMSVTITFVRHTTCNLHRRCHYFRCYWRH